MQQKIIKYVATNDRGYRIGQDHHGSKLSDAEVEQIRDLHEYAGWPYRKIAREYGASKSCIAEICRYEKRCQTVFDWKKVVVIPAGQPHVEGPKKIGLCPTKEEARRLSELAKPKGDSSWFERVPWAKLKRIEVTRIKIRFKNGESVKSIHKDYPWVSAAYIRRMVETERKRKYVNTKANPKAVAVEE